MQTSNRKLPKSFSIINIRQNPDRENKTSEERIPRGRKSMQRKWVVERL